MIAVPLAIKGVVEILLIADAGDVTGAGGQLFSQLGKKAAGMSASALRELIAQEARVACRSAVEAAAHMWGRRVWQLLRIGGPAPGADLRRTGPGER